MSSTERYADILVRCLQLEDKARRDAVLAELPAKRERVRVMVLERYEQRGAG